MFFRTLKHVVQYSPLLNEVTKLQIFQTPANQSIKGRFTGENLPLSELPQLLNKQIMLDVPVYTVWGACEDVKVLEKFRSGEYKVEKLHILDEANSSLLEAGGVKLRLLGLGGAVVMHKLFDNGEGKTTIAGGQGTMWTTLLQMGELIDTANRVYDPTETRILLTHASPAREGMLNQLSVSLKADFSISAGLHFRYGSSYNEFSVNPSLDHYRGKLAASKASFNDVWETVRAEVDQAIQQNEGQKIMLGNALDIVDRMPSMANGGNPFGEGPVGAARHSIGQVDESAFKNMWNFNLADAAFGYLVLDIEGGRIGTEMRAQGFNFAHREGSASVKAPYTQQLPASNVPPQGPAAGVAGTPTGGLNQSRGPAFAAPNPPFPQPPSQTPRPQPAPAIGKTASQPVLPGASDPAAASRSVSEDPKSTTSQPSITNVSLPTKGNDINSGNQPAKLTTANGSNAQQVNSSPTAGASSTGGTTGAADSQKQSTAASVPEKKPPTALYILNVESEEQARGLFQHEDDKKTIKEVYKFGKTANYVVSFETNEQCKAAFERQPAERKTRQKDPKIANIRYFEDRQGSNRSFHHHHHHHNTNQRDNQGGPGAWQGSNRGGSNAGAGVAGAPSARGGYQSGGASDSEGGRGGRGGGYRGRGGRGRGGGDDRGGRGVRGGNRGGYQNRNNTDAAITSGTNTSDNKAGGGGGENNNNNNNKQPTAAA